LFPHQQGFDVRSSGVWRPLHFLKVFTRRNMWHWIMGVESAHSGILTSSVCSLQFLRDRTDMCSAGPTSILLHNLSKLHDPSRRAELTEKRSNMIWIHYNLRTAKYFGAPKLELHRRLSSTSWSLFFFLTNLVIYDQMVLPNFTLLA